MGRKEIALQGIDLKGRGLELGPLYNPVVLKSEGNIQYVDHMSYEDLKKKYGQDAGVPLDQIVPTDYVLKNNSLKDTVKGKKFDYVVASHVIEHIPDMVRWLADVASILKTGGILSLVIPDKRFTFDMHRNESRPADVMGAYLDQHTRFSSASMYDDTYEYRDAINPSDVWRDPLAYKDQKPALQAREKALQRCQNNLIPDNYVDCHCYVLTPYSFFEIIKSLIEHDLLDYEVASFTDTPQNELEFYVILKKSKKSQEERLRSVPRLVPTPKTWDLEAEIRDLKQQLNKLTQSRSWRITRPLRLFMAAFKKAE